eukprot:895944-Prorocentrum_minimum.AAC.1
MCIRDSPLYCQPPCIVNPPVLSTLPKKPVLGRSRSSFPSPPMVLHRWHARIVNPPDIVTAQGGD